MEIQLFSMGPGGEILWRIDGGMKEYITKQQFYFKDIYQVQIYSTNCTEPLAKTIKEQLAQTYQVFFIFTVSPLLAVSFGWGVGSTVH